MSNVVYEDKIFNEEVKREFINSHKPGTQKNLERIFKMTQPSEADLNKDLYKFTREELRKLFYTFMASTPSASKSSVQYVSSYINWAIDEGYYGGSNPLETVDVKWKEQFVIRPEKVFWTDEEIKEMVKKIVTAQVAVVFYAPFIGIKGTENAEIVNLKKSDIDFSNLTAKLKDADGSERTIEIDQVFADLCKAAYAEEEYTKSNGKPDQNIRAEMAKLIDNEFIVRSVDIGVINTEEADGMVVYRRFNTVSDFFNEPNLKPMTVAYSGMLALAKDLMLAGGLNEESYKKIGERFKLNEQSLKRCRKDFLNESLIRDLYEIS